jgi:hypothetical protein
MAIFFAQTHRALQTTPTFWGKGFGNCSKKIFTYIIKWLFKSAASLRESVIVELEFDKEISTSPKTD